MKQDLKIKIEGLFRSCDEHFIGGMFSTNIVLDEKSTITEINYSRHSVSCSLQNGNLIVNGFPIRFLSDDIIEKIINELERRINKLLKDKDKLEDTQYCGAL